MSCVMRSRAALCLDCDAIFDQWGKGECPNCGSRAWVPVGSFEGMQGVREVVETVGIGNGELRESEVRGNSF